MLQLKEEKANLNKTVKLTNPCFEKARLNISTTQVQALRSEAEQLSQEIAEFHAQLPAAGGSLL